MNCPHCGAENEADALVCTTCARALTEQPPTEAKPAGESFVPFEPFADEAPIEPAEPPKKKSPVGLIVTLCIVVAALLVMVLILVRHAIPDAAPTADDDGSSTPLTGEVISPDDSTAAAAPTYPVTVYTSPALVPADAMDTQIGSCGGISIDNRALNYYYWGEFNYLRNYYGSNLTMLLDPTVPLGEQAFRSDGKDYTWQDYLLENSVGTIKETCALLTQARAEGFTLSEEDGTYLEQLRTQLPELAAQYGYTDADSYLRAAYGTGAELESFLTFMEDSLLASAYANQLHNSFSYTEDEISAYYTDGGYAEAGLAQDDTRNIDVRHILIQAQDENGEEDWPAALAKAEEILAMWETSPTEDHFAALAGEYSTDPGSQNNGGLYTGVSQGQMVQTFNDWCFDPARQPGDTGIVETSYGYHIMYFVAHADRPAWMETVEADMRREAYSNTVAGWVAQNGFEFDYEAAVLSAPVGLYE